MKYIRILIPVLSLALCILAWFAIPGFINRSKEKEILELIEKSIKENNIDYCIAKEEKEYLAKMVALCPADEIAELETLVQVWWEAYFYGYSGVQIEYPEMPEGTKTVGFIDNNPICKYYSALRAMEMGTDDYCWNYLLNYYFQHEEQDGSRVITFKKEDR